MRNATARLAADWTTRRTAPGGPLGVVRVQVVDADAPGLVVDLDARTVSADTGPEADVVLRIGAEDLLRWADGETDGALLHLAGRLEVVGEEALLLPLVDPASLDPVAVSAAIADVGTEHLEAVMAGAFRELVLTEVFRRLPEFLIAEKAERVRVAVLFEIEGPGEPDQFLVTIADGRCAVRRDPEDPGSADATLVLAGHEFLRLVLGHLNPVRGVVSGQVRVRGQVLKALGFNAVMRIPGS